MSKAAQADISVVWQPIPDTSQEFAIDTRCDETLYCGSRGPGKTDCQLMRFRRHVGVGYGKFWRGIIFDREYKNLDDLVSKAKRWFNEFNDGAVWLSSNAQYKWVWPTGEELLFRAAKKIEDYDEYHGHEYPFIGWNELTKYPNDKLYDMFMSCNRSSFTPTKDGPKDAKGQLIQPLMAPIPLEVFSTTNPWGPGHSWVKRRFIDPAPYGTVVRRPSVVYNPQTKQDETIIRTQVTIFGSYKENPYLDPKYIATLNANKNENLRKAWLEGSWDVVAGGAFDDVWDATVHVLPRFPIPSSWKMDRSFDWGSSEPFWVGWWAETNGEEVIIKNPDGTFRVFAPYPKSIILFDELYGTESIGTNVGVRWSAGKIADEIVKREDKLRETRWVVGKVYPGPADNQISAKSQSDVETIEKKMAARGVKWTKSDKSPGSRINGFELLRNRLEAAMTGDGPAIYFMEHNRATVSILPTLPRDTDNPDDVDTEAEEHPYDGVRYRCLANSRRAVQQLKVAFPNAG